MLKKLIFLSDYIGLCNRLEALTLSFAIQERYGHEICIDWPELDAIRIVGTYHKAIRLWDRIGSIKIRMCSEEQFESLGGYRTIIQRTAEGPEAILDRLFLLTAERIRLRPELIRAIQQTLKPFSGRPVVGVHIRRGDFKIADDMVYNAGITRHQALPLWWYEFVMGAISEKYRDVAFFLSCTGDPEAYRTLKANFDIFQNAINSPYQCKGESHQSTSHPVVDLFTLACCSMIISTPMSTFSHYAANALGLPSISILPHVLMNKESPRFGFVTMYGKRAPEWVRVSKEGRGLAMVQNSVPIPAPRETEVQWMY